MEQSPQFRPDYQLVSEHEDLSEDEIRVREAKYMLLKACNLGLTDYMITKISRNDVPQHQFMGSIRKAIHGQFHGLEGWDEGHIETTAVELGLDEIIWGPINGEAA